MLSGIADGLSVARGQHLGGGKVTEEVSIFPKFVAADRYVGFRGWRLVALTWAIPCFARLYADVISVMAKL